jgi:hypothetical protein
MSNDRQRQQRTPADADGRSLPGQARCGAGSRYGDLASGRRGQRFGSRSSSEGDPCLSACTYDCTYDALPNLIKAALAAPLGPASAPGSASEGPPGARRARRQDATHQPGSSGMQPVLRATVLTPNCPTRGAQRAEKLGRVGAFRAALARPS